jgi:DNA-binding LacI/PurR family transcriptional regulator
MLYFQDKQINIPEQIGLVGFSDNPNASLLRPALTTIHQPAYEIGRTAAALLIDIMAGKAPKKPSTITLKTRLVIRGST